MFNCRLEWISQVKDKLEEFIQKVAFNFSNFKAINSMYNFQTSVEREKNKGKTEEKTKVKKPRSSRANRKQVK